MNRARSPWSVVRSPWRRAFTLIELIVSIAIILILLIGVSQVFRLTQQTVSAGQKLSETTRDHKAAMAVFYNDFRGVATVDQPAMIIASFGATAYKNVADDQADVDRNVLTVDLTDSGSEVNYGPYTYNLRNHRNDIFSFFARGTFPRQTANTNAFASNLGSNEAWIWYGHLALPNNAGTTYYTPGAADASATDRNDNNRYATQWALGRMAILLRAKEPDGFIKDNAGVNQEFIDAASESGLIPLALNSVVKPTVNNPVTGQPWKIQESRYDLAATTITEYRERVRFASAASIDWWMPLVYRFQCDPFVSRPPNADAVARTAPYFLGGCTQFIVEYAGDFLSQDDNGEIKTAAGQPVDGPDGRVDFVIDKTADPGDSSRWVKRIRWYGAPRKVTATTTATPVILQTPPAGGTINDLVDVVPLRDVRRAALLVNPNKPASDPMKYEADFEKRLPLRAVPSPAEFNYNNPAASFEPYVCAWGPNDPKPSMIRITVQLEDPAGRLPDGQVYEHVLGGP